MGASEAFVDVNFAKIRLGRSMTSAGGRARRRAVVVLGYGPYEALFLPNGHRPGGQAGARRRHGATR